MINFNLIKGDIAVESSRHAAATLLSTSRGSYVVSRMTTNGNIPYNQSPIRQLDYLPKWLKSILGDLSIPKSFNHIADNEKRGTKPRMTTQSMIINDEILYQIAFGKITVCKEIINTEGKTVYFKGGIVEHDVDAIILCTGYTRKFPFLDEKIFKLEKSGKFLPLYKGIFPVERNESLAFVGMFSTPLNSVAFTSELQARYIAERFQGNIKLPSMKVMEESIRSKRKDFDEQFGENLKELNYVSKIVWY